MSTTITINLVRAFPTEVERQAAADALALGGFLPVPAGSVVTTAHVRDGATFVHADPERDWGETLDALEAVEVAYRVVCLAEEDDGLDRVVAYLPYLGRAESDCDPEGRPRVSPDALDALAAALRQGADPHDVAQRIDRLTLRPWIDETPVIP